jgi:hypothetical protein
VLIGALSNWLRRYSGRAGHGKKAAEWQERQAQYVERLEKKNGLEPKLGEVYRRPIVGYLEKEATNRRLVEVTRGLLARLKAADDPDAALVSQEAIEHVKAGGSILCRQGEEPVWGALVPPHVHSFFQMIVRELGGWDGPWTIVKLPMPEDTANGPDA